MPKPKYIEECEAVKVEQIQPIVVKYADIHSNLDFYLPEPMESDWYKFQRDTDKKKATRFLNYHCGFDTETTTVIEREEKIKKVKNKKVKINKIKKANGYVWVWQFCVNDIVIYGRKLSEFIELLNIMCERFNLDDTHKMRIWVANLGFEFQFIRKLITITNLFARRSREPIKFETNNGFIFQDCLSISGGNLEHLAATYCATKKMVGDLDYNKPRNSMTPITDKEMGYIVNDVVILSEFDTFLYETYIKRGFEVPMTKTGFLRTTVKKRYEEWVMGDNKKIDWNLLKGFKNSFPIESEYKIMMEYLFRGGYVHSNVKHTGKKLSNVFGWDFTSSYPACLLQGSDYPCGRFKPVNKIPENKPYYAKFKFTNIKNTTTHSIESSSKCVDLVNPIIDNGRVMYAESMTVYLTNLDFELYQLFYKWDGEPEVTDIMESEYGRLPEYLLEPIKYFYKKKAQLKKAGLDETTAYKIAKAMVNSAYGLLVEKLLCPTADYDLETLSWGEGKANSYYKRLGLKQKYKPYPNVVLLPQWGIWCTALARYRLLKMVYEVGSDCVYCDTDSIYLINPEKHRDKFLDWNKDVMEYNREHFTEEFLDLGCFDPVSKDGKPFTYFKTLGAKRYVKQGADGHIECTIAGLPKASLDDYCKKKKLDIFDTFTNEMYVDIAFANKNAHAYNDSAHEDIIEDEFGNVETMHSESSIGIFPISFTMNIKEFYWKLMEYTQSETFNGIDENEVLQWVTE